MRITRQDLTPKCDRQKQHSENNGEPRQKGSPSSRLIFHKGTITSPKLVTEKSQFSSSSYWSQRVTARAQPFSYVPRLSGAQKHPNPWTHRLHKTMEHGTTSCWPPMKPPNPRSLRTQPLLQKPFNSTRLALHTPPYPKLQLRSSPRTLSTLWPRYVQDFSLPCHDIDLVEATKSYHASFFSVSFLPVGECGISYLSRSDTNV